MTDNCAAEIEIVKQIYAAINQNRLLDVQNLFDRDIVRIEPEGFPSAGTYRGHSEVMNHISQGRGTWAEGACQPEGFIAAGDKIIVLLHVRVRLKDRTSWSEGRFSDVFTFRDKKILEMRSFGETHDALLWAGVAIS